MAQEGFPICPLQEPGVQFPKPLSRGYHERCVFLCPLASTRHTPGSVVRERTLRRSSSQNWHNSVGHWLQNATRVYSIWWVWTLQRCTIYIISIPMAFYFQCWFNIALQLIHNILKRHETHTHNAACNQLSGSLICGRTSGGNQHALFT